MTLTQEESRVDDVLEHCEVVRLRPNDILVLMTDEHLTQDAAERLEESARAVFDHERLVVLAGGVQVGVIACDQ